MAWCLVKQMGTLSFMYEYEIAFGTRWTDKKWGKVKVKLSLGFQLSTT